MLELILRQLLLLPFIFLSDFWTVSQVMFSLVNGYGLLLLENAKKIFELLDLAHFSHLVI